MAARNSSSSFKLQTLVTLLCRHRAISGGLWQSHQSHHRDLSPHKLGRGSSVDQGLRFMSVTSGAHSQTKLEMEKNQSEGAQVRPAILAPPKFGFSTWVKWLLGSVLSLLLPFWKDKWDYLLTFEGEAEKVVEEVGVVAEVVEKVATTADMALAEVANHLPDNSKLKEVAQVMENASRAAAEDAQLIDNVIHKVGNVKQDLEDLESAVEPIVEKIVQRKHPKI